LDYRISIDETRTDQSCDINHPLDVKVFIQFWLRTYFAIRFIISLKFLEITLGQKIYEIYLLERSGLGRIFSIYHAILKKR